MHPEADALLDAIFDNPDEDTPRLVYADWLQEHGHEDYAQFIRQSHLIERGTFSPREHKQLRRDRHLLGQRIEQAFPLARHVTLAKGHPLDGLPRRSHITEANYFLETWPNWWPFLHPRVLQLRSVSGIEDAVAQCPYLSRIEALMCEGEILSGSMNSREECHRRPVNACLLHQLAANETLIRLTALKIEPLQATSDDLLAFADTAFAIRLEELDLWIDFGSNSHETLWAMKDTVRHEIHRFVAEHRSKML